VDFGITLAINNNFLVEGYLFDIGTTAVDDNEIPEGRNLLAGQGQAQFLTDDGESGLLPVPLGQWLDGGRCLCMTFNNTDPANAQPVFGRVSLMQEEGRIG
jgi:hypothetical protein